jgi:hypothetical protein
LADGRGTLPLPKKDILRAHVIQAGAFHTFPAISRMHFELGHWFEAINELSAWQARIQSPS